MNEQKLLLANKELAFQNEEKEKRAAELILANKELTFQNQEKEKRAAELVIANEKLFYETLEKEKRAAELVLANKELISQNSEKEKLAAELIIANEKLAYQNKEKERRAAELIIANEELIFQNKEKERRAAELIIANDELAYQNKEKEKRAAELVLANEELIFQNKEKEKRAAELLIANKELESFTFISSHDLQEPLRKIRILASRILENEYENLSASGRDYFERMQRSAFHMQMMINDLLAYSRTRSGEKKFEQHDLNKILAGAIASLKNEIESNGATIESNELITCMVIAPQFGQLFKNLISNSLKFSKAYLAPHIVITGTYMTADSSNPNLSAGQTYYHISVSDNGIGFDQQYHERIFGIFQHLNDKKDFEGTGMGLTVVKKIVENHDGIITAVSELNKGSIFNIYIPVK